MIQRVRLWISFDSESSSWRFSLPGLGLLDLRKWAALMISLMALDIAILWEREDALHPIPGCANWLGFVFALLLTAPSILTGVCWRSLTWRGDHRLFEWGRNGEEARPLI